MRGFLSLLLLTPFLPAQSVRPVQLKCEYQSAPLGLEVRKPRFSWALEAGGRRGAAQGAYRILVASSLEALAKDQGDLWDTGKVTSSRTTQVVYEGAPLRSRQVCFWKVRSWDEKDRPSPWSDPASFEMALLKKSDWKAAWITPGPSSGNPKLLGKTGKEAGQGPRRSMLARKEFLLEKEPLRARAYVTGLGLYELRLNGKKVGDDLFTPGWTLYSKRVPYQVYDVTALLKKGPNAAGVLLGNGWWSSGLGWRKKAFFAAPGENLRLLLQLEITFTDGTKKRVLSGPDWSFHPSPIVEDTLYNGETYDARLELPGWDRPGFQEEGWTKAKVLDPPPAVSLTSFAGPPIRTTRVLRARRITSPAPGKWIFDFGVNHAGRCVLSVRAPRGTKITIRHAEVLKPDGTLYTANLRSARATDVYICKGKGLERWEPRFTYHGFRYAEITGLPEEPTRATLVSKVIHSAPPPAGTFRCSNPLLNRILQNVRRGQGSNMYSVPTDCPQRDERLGWMGDAQVFSPTACWNMDMALFFSKWARDIRDSQSPEGATTDVSPVIVVQGPAKPAWGDAVAVVPWTVYRFYGDRRVLEENYGAVKAWVEYMRKHSKGDLYERKGYGDWVAVVRSPTEPVGSAYYFRSTSILARMARILGKKKDAKQYAALAGRIAAAYQKKHYRPDRVCYDTGTQTMNLLPLAFGITPKGLRPAVAAAVAADVRARGNHLSTGFLGTDLLLPMLTEYGFHDLAYKVIATREYPSLGYMISKGATTIWELWNSDKAGPGMNSRNHFAFGSMTRWFFEGLGGIRPDPERPGFAHVFLKPLPAGDLKWVEAVYPSLHGEFRLSWRIERGRFHLDVTLPPNTSADLVYPWGEAAEIQEGKDQAGKARGVTFLEKNRFTSTFRLLSGEYHFSSPWKGRE